MNKELLEIPVFSEEGEEELLYALAPGCTAAAHGFLKPRTCA